jgi:hypothetical protein
MVQQMSVSGFDIAKLVFHVVGMDDPGAVVLRKQSSPQHPGSWPNGINLTQVATY